MCHLSKVCGKLADTHTRQMKIFQIEYFLTLAECGSFQKTADRYYVTQPAVSKQITLLEKELGLTLFNRRYRGVSLTASGEMLRDCFQRCAEDYRQTLKTATELEKNAKHAIRIGLPERVTFGNLLEILNDYQLGHPNDVLHIDQKPLTGLRFSSKEEDYDLIINHTLQVQDFTKLRHTHLIRSQRMLIISKKHPLMKDGYHDFSQFSSLVFFTQGENIGNPSVNIIHRICNQNGFAPCEIRVSPNLDSVLLACDMCSGGAILDETVDLTGHKNLVMIPTGTFTDIEILWPIIKNTPALRSLISYIRSGLVMPTVGGYL